CMRHKALPLTF
nr:immunoglobulin light chain junction region [Macaca mulatta]